MLKDYQPTRAESYDIFSTLKQDTSGLVLATKNVIGINPIKFVEFLKKLIHICKKFTK